MSGLVRASDRSLKRHANVPSRESVLLVTQIDDPANCSPISIRYLKIACVPVSFTAAETLPVWLGGLEACSASPVGRPTRRLKSPCPPVAGSLWTFCFCDPPACCCCVCPDEASSKPLISAGLQQITSLAGLLHPNVTQATHLSH